MAGHWWQRGILGTVTRSFLLASACLGLSVSSAQAVDWSVQSTLSETLEINDNRQMRFKPLGMSYNPSTWLGVDASALTPTSRLDLNGYLKYRIYAGPGEQGIPDALDRGVCGRFEKWQKLTSYNLTGSHSEIDTSSIQQQETGFATLSGLTITDQIGGGLRHVFGPRDAIQWQTTWTSTTFTQAGLTPTDNLTSYASWTHNVSPITTLIPSLQFQHLTYHNASQSEVMFWTAKNNTADAVDQQPEIGGRRGGGVC